MTFLKFLFLLLSVVLSSIINRIYIDSMLNIFNVMSNFALVANRVALALFFYFFLELIFLTKRVKVKTIINQLFLIYFIWLMGMLFGRFVPIENYNLDSHFNFKSFIPEWIYHLDNPLVLYYLIGNILVYIPFGMFLRFHRPLLFAFFYVILIILFFETVQGVTNLGYFDIDDVILNGIGGLIGITIIEIYHKLKHFYFDFI